MIERLDADGTAMVIYGSAMTAKTVQEYANTFGKPVFWFRGEWSSNPSEAVIRATARKFMPSKEAI